ncbi:hypothetical protein [Streptomyces sp. NPDC001389]|uniref:hypothetical protein n=1 Tax=Streptomyces sp. NPDC001389 TaxID=3364569 RepID=UPI0036C6AE42
MNAEYLHRIVSDYEINVEPVLIKHGTDPVGTAAARAFASRWPRRDIQAAMDALSVVISARSGTGLAQALANLGR